MAKTYKLQSLLVLNFDTQQDLTSATVTQVKYIKPDETPGVWEAVGVGTTISYDVQNNDIDQTGTWKMWPYYEIAGENARGKTVRLTVLPNDE